MEKDLPKGWAVCKVGDFLQLKNGYAFKSKDYKDEGVPLIRISDIQSGYVTSIKSTCIEEDNIKDGFYVEHGDVLIAMSGATTGKYGIFIENKKVLQNQRVGNLKPLVPESIDKKYIYYFLGSLKKEIENRAYGAAQPNISPKLIEGIDCLCPPFLEQKRIVAKLDSLFASLESTKTRLEKIPTLLKNFKQAILTQAVTGKLTEQWREGKELEDMNQFIKDLGIQRKNKYEEAVLYAKKNKLKKPKKDFEFEYRKHSDRKNWCVAKLDNLIYMSARIGWKGLKADEYTSEGPLFLSVHGLNHGEKVNFDVAYHITEERYAESPEIMLEENDILLCKDGAGIGKLGVVKDLKEKATVNSSLLVIRGREALNYKFLYYFFAGPALQNIAKERITGTAIPHLFQKDIKEFWVEIPPLEEQTEIVRRVESLFAKADAIEAQYTKLKQKIDTLPQAILAKAFRGELVEQNPLDEPASVLLEKIKALREAEVKPKRKTVRKKKSASASL